MKDHGFIATDFAVLSGSLCKRSGKVVFCKKENAHFSFPFCLLLLPTHHATPGSLSFSFKNKYNISIYFDIFRYISRLFLFTVPLKSTLEHW